ncbi:permease [Streptomyces nanshensis]|nr:permease [Streptomyces nanshensis]
MRTLILLALAGLGAQLVDGSLGMAYGVTSTTLLLAVGTNPAAASATVHLAEIGTTLVSGASHWRFGNVDWKVVAKIGVPGAVGAFAGATVLSGLSTAVAEPAMALILLTLGLYLLGRFTFVGFSSQNLGKPLRKRFLSPLGLVAGFVDATGGGGWGPVGTPAILASGRLEPRKVIGSIDTSEFLVSVAASIGFLAGLGSEGIDLAWAGALLVGGVIAAPIAAWLVRHVPPRVLGSAVGGIIVITNTRTLLGSDWIGAGGSVSWAVYVVLYAAWAAALAYSIREHRRNSARERQEARTGADAESETAGAGTGEGAAKEGAPSA